MGLTICTVNDILCPSTLDLSKVKFAMLRNGGETLKKMEETSGRATD